MFSDPQFWVALAFVVFVIAIFNPVRKLLSSSLDTKIKEIKDSIDQAEDLKNETQANLSEIKKRQSEVKNEIEEIKKSAKNKIQILENQAKEKLVDLTAKKELLASEKIEQMARDANLEIQEYISRTSIEASIIVLKKKLDKEGKQNLINSSIKELSSIIKN